MRQFAAAGLNPDQERQAGIEQLTPIQSERSALPQARRQEDAFVALPQILQRRGIPAKGRAQLETNPHAFERIHLRGHDVLWHAIGRNAVGQHPARAGHLIQDRHGMTGLSQEVGRSEPGRTRAHDRHPPARFDRGRPVKRRRVFQHVIAQETLYITDRHRLVVTVPVAIRLAGVRTNASRDRRQRIRAQEDPGRLVNLAGAQPGHIRRDVIMNRAAAHARCSADAHAAEDGMVAVLGKQSVTSLPALTQTVEGVVGVTIVPAARLLA